jgi:hypothetical protein
MVIAETSSSARRRRFRVAALVRCVGFLLLGLGAASTAVSLLGTQVHRWRAFDVTMRIRPALHGETRLALPPLGEIRAATHRGPFALDLQLQQIRIEEIGPLLAARPSRQDVEREFRRFARRASQ